VLELLRKGAVDRNNFQGNFDEIMVNGRIMDGAKLDLARIRLGELVTSKVIVTILEGDLFIMDENLLAKFGAFRIDSGKQQIIFNQER